MPQLADWGNFYVIVGSAAGGLTGLMFVVIALGSQARTIGSERGLSAFATPTVVHFCAALLVASLVSSPLKRPETLGAALGVFGVCGLAYVGWAMQQARHQSGYKPVGEDWLWHGCMPILAYGAMVCAAVMLFTGNVGPALFVLGAAVLLLLFTGIHNAWDTAIWIATSTGRRPRQREAKK